ncbi:protein LEO1 homolog isoform X2 [Populus alba]|uniref:protein LEO1 homolog isoform X2 n=1 Tax=Populus alba TaxID=43335 RepID=UPI003CC7331A
MGEEKRHQMMQNLFGDQSEEEEEIDSEHESNPQPNYASDEAEGELRNDGEGEGEVDGQEDVHVESEGEMREVEPDPGESEGEREQSSQEVDIGDQRDESDAKDSDSDAKEEYGHRVATSRRRDVIESGSEEHHYVDHEDEEVDQARSPSKSPEEEKDQAQNAQSAPAIRDVFGDSEDEEEDAYAVRNDIEQDSNRSPMEEEESYEKNLRPEDMLADEDAQYESEEENREAKPKEKPLGPPLEIEMPFCQPPADPKKMNMIKVSNIMGIDPNQFDPKTYVEEKTFVTDESGAQKRIRLENNIVRWRTVKNPDGSNSVESNARFVRWSDGSLQLLIGNEVLDISVQDAQQDQTHLFLRHNKSLLQSQGRILRKMRFMPSSLSSNSHRLLTALVDSRHRKAYKVKNCITDIDPEREKEEKEKAESQTIRANVLLNRKREKVSRKYTPTVERRRQLSPGFLEGALDEDDEPDYYNSRRSRRFEEDLEVEARAEKRIMNAKKRDIPRKSSMSAVKSSKRPVDFSDSEREESEYETDGDEYERSPVHKRVDEPEHEYEEEEEEHYEEDIEVNGASEEEEEPKQKGKEFGSGRKRIGFESEEDSPPRKIQSGRRMTVVYDSDEE